MKINNLFAVIINLATLPLRFSLSHKNLNRLGLRSLKDERIEKVLSLCKGNVLDIGCGEGNELIRQYKSSGKSGVGVDVYNWAGVDIICNTKNLPFENASFDTIAMIAVFNHIVEKEVVLQECRRVLRKDGSIIITVLNPLIGKIRHKLAWWDKDQHERGMKDGEVYGMSQQTVEMLLGSAGFLHVRRMKFIYNLNNIYLGSK